MSEIEEVIRTVPSKVLERVGLQPPTDGFDRWLKSLRPAELHELKELFVLVSTQGNEAINLQEVDELIQRCRYFYKLKFPPEEVYTIGQLKERLINALVYKGLQKSPSLLNWLNTDPISVFREPKGNHQNSKVWYEYWQNHTKAYTNQLDTHSENVLKRLNRDTIVGLAGYKCVVAIPAMNETNLVGVVNALQESYGDSFSQDVAVIIFHNYKGPRAQILPEVLKSVQEVMVYQNVAVIEQQVPENCNTGMAKKTVSDVALRVIGSKLDKPIVMVDADVVALSNGAIQKALVDINLPHKLAASPEFDYRDQEIYNNYPLLKIIFELRSEIHQKIDPTQRGMTKGAFYVIPSRVLTMVGGLIPYQFEDTFLTDVLGRFGGLFRDGKPNLAYDPISKMQGHHVLIDASRELKAVELGESIWGRWLSTRDHQEISGSPRITDISRIPELTIISSDVFCHLLRLSVPFVLNEIPADDNKNTVCLQARLLFEGLKKRGIKIIRYSFSTLNGKIYTDRSAAQYILQSNQDWYFTSIDEVDLSNLTNS